MTRNPPPGQFVVDISETLPIKLEAIRAYRTQFPPAKERVFPLVEGYNRLSGQSAGFDAGELFYSPSVVGVKDLVQTVLGMAPGIRPVMKPTE